MKVKYILLSVLFIVTSTIFSALIGVYAADRLNWQGWVVLYMFLATFCLIIVDIVDISLLFFINMILLIMLQIVGVEEALNGFSNPGIAAIAILFIVAESIQQSGLTDLLIRYILRNPKNSTSALARLIPAVSFLSAFTNNTPIVAILIPTLEYWSIQTEIPLTYLLMPLSYAAILGGTCTLIGTSTNIIILSLIREKEPDFTLNLFEIGIVGWPIVILGSIYMIFLSKYLLPEATEKRSHINRVYSYYSSTELLDLDKHYPGVIIYKVYKKRDLDDRIEVMFDQTKIFIGNYYYKYIYVMVGVKQCLQGLANKHCLKLMCKCEFLSSNDLVLVKGDNVDYALFELETINNNVNYDWNILKINRKGKSLGQVGDVIEKDVLLVESSYELYSKKDDFKWIKEVELVDCIDIHPCVNTVKMMILVGLVIAMIIITSLNILSLFTSASLVALGAVIMKILKWDDAMMSIHGKVILLLATSFSLSLALENVGLAQLLGEGFLYLFSNSHPFGILCGIYLLANLLSSIVSNAATAVLLFPVVWNIALNSSLSVKTAMYVLMIASSVSLITPIGYQTNLMVQKAGGYKTIHYLKFGSLLSVICMFTVCGILYGYN